MTNEVFERGADEEDVSPWAAGPAGGGGAGLTLGAGDDPIHLGDKHFPLFLHLFLFLLFGFRHGVQSVIQSGMRQCSHCLQAVHITKPLKCC